LRQQDRPGIVAPPPLLYAVALLTVLVLDRVWPRPVFEHAFTVPVGCLAIIAGLTLTLWGVRSMRRARTPINPYSAAETVVGTGAFAISRNPLYVGLDLVLLGFVLVVNSLWGIGVWAVLLGVMHYGVILPEERYLAGRFGEQYERYRSAVRRYL
jgi:protein-S-isoprenylcysteine O-methyltransferase Ste14